MRIAKRIHAVEVFFGGHPSGLATGPLDLNPPFLNSPLDEAHVVVPENLGDSGTRISENHVAVFGLTPVKVLVPNPLAQRSA
jgi:hypothetical protein